MKWRLRVAKPDAPAGLVDLEAETAASMVDAILSVGYDGLPIPYALRLHAERIVLVDPRAAVQMIDAYLNAAPRRQAAAARLRKARRAHRSSAGSLRRERPAWQRSGARWRGTRIEPAMTNPRARGQLSA